MKKEVKSAGLLIFLLIAIISIIFISENANSKQNKKINEEVYRALEKNGEVNVVIKISPDEHLKAYSNNVINIKGVKHNNQLITALLNKTEIENLNLDDGVEIVEYVPQIRASLQNTTTIVNATNVWVLSVDSVNLTGIDETICVIDTGVNFSHPDLLGKNKTCIIDCFNKECIENCTLSDDNGHGTHIAGIVAASGAGGLKGIAPDSKIIGIKVLNSTGSAHYNTGTIDIKNAIDWCVEKRNLYNISVISMSFGTETIYSDYCDAAFSATFTPSINNATYYNISIIASSGNGGSNTSISSPACIKNVTAVGATEKNNTLASYSNNGPLIDLMAPGTEINSTYKNGKYALYSGTSMSVPHVAAAFAIIRQLYRLQRGIPYTPAQIQNKLKNNGFNISDNFGVNYTRIDIYKAAIASDDLEPDVSLISPENGTSLFNNTASFRCNGTDLSLKNMTFYLWNATSIYNQTQIDIAGNSYQYEINVSLNLVGNYYWNCLFYDSNGNSAISISNYTLSISNISVTLVSPPNGIITSNNFTYVCNGTSDVNLTNATLYIWNSTSQVYHNTTNVSGTRNSTTFAYNFTKEGRYLWNCLFSNYANLIDFASVNYSITYDLTPPILNSIYPQNNSWNNAGRFNVTINENGSCSYSLDGGITNNSMLSVDNMTFYAINLSMAQRAYNISYYCNDSAGNLNNSVLRVFKIDTEPPSVTLNSPINNYNVVGKTSISFGYNVTDNINISMCNLIINDEFAASNSSAISLENTIVYEVSPGSYKWKINCTDEAGNIGSSDERNIRINETASTDGGSSSNTDSSLTNIPMVYAPSQIQILAGYVKELASNDRILFKTDDGNPHTLILINLSSTYANISIRSSPIYILLGIGDTKKINITNENYYELYIKLNGIRNSKANLTIQKIYEKIEMDNQLEKDYAENNDSINTNNLGFNEESNRETYYKKAFIYIIKYKWWILAGLFLAVVSFLIIIALYYFRMIVAKKKTKD